MTIANKADISGYVGPKGSGKSYLALMDSKKEKRLLRLEFAGDKAFEEGAVVCRSLLETLRALSKWKGRQKKQHICFHVPRGLDYAIIIETICKAIVSVGGGALLLDEAQKFLRPNQKLGEYTTMVLEEGRKVRVPLYWTTLLPKQISFYIRNQSDTLALFDAYGGLYEGFYREYVGKGKAGTVFIDKLHNAPKYSYIFHQSGEKPTLKIVKA